MLYGIIAAAIIIFDQFFKHWIVTNISLGTDLAFMPGIVHLTNVRNTGAAFSMLSSSTLLLTIITVVFIIGLIVYLCLAKLNIASRICVAAVIGGAIGNLIDRIRLGYVVDMFEVEFMEYAVFNVADCFVVVGVILFCVFYLISETKKEKALKAEKAEADEDGTDDSNDQL